MTWRTEFSDFPDDCMPDMPAGFEDGSWHNDVCPLFYNEAAGLMIGVDHPDPEERWMDGARFTLHRLDEEHQPVEVLLNTDDWPEMVEAVRTYGLELRGDEPDASERADRVLVRAVTLHDGTEMPLFRFWAWRGPGLAELRQAVALARPGETIEAVEVIGEGSLGGCVMTDDELRQFLTDTVSAAVEAAVPRAVSAAVPGAVAAAMATTMATVNVKLDDILDRLSRDREDIDNTRGLVLYALEDSLTLGKRLTKAEDEIRRARRGDGS